MGIGDWIMALGEAQEHYRQTGERTLFRHPKGHVVWEEIFDGCEAVAREPGDGVREVVEGGGVRPYIAEKTAVRWSWKPYKPKPATLTFRPEHIEFARNVLREGRIDVLIEPSIKMIGHHNKDWGRVRWALLCRALIDAGLSVAQFFHTPGAHIFFPRDLSRIEGGGGARLIQTPTFMHAACVMQEAARAGAVGVLPEGGLHHAAAAVGLRSVVIYGGFISPEQTGYAMHRNLFAGGEPCGSRFDCPHCAAAMNDIKPIDVFAEAIGLLNEVSANGTR